MRIAALILAALCTVGAVAVLSPMNAAKAVELAAGLSLAALADWAMSLVRPRGRGTIR